MHLLIGNSTHALPCLEAIILLLDSTATSQLLAGNGARTSNFEGHGMSSREYMCVCRLAWNLLGLMNNSQYVVRTATLQPHTTLDLAKTIDAMHIRFVHPVNGGMQQGGWMTSELPDFDVSLFMPARCTLLCRSAITCASLFASFSHSLLSSSHEFVSNTCSHMFVTAPVHTGKVCRKQCKKPTHDILTCQTICIV